MMKNINLNKKKGRFYSNLLILALLLQLLSCNKFLDTQPQNVTAVSNYFTTATQLNNALTGVYDILATSNVYGDAMWDAFSVATDESYYTVSTTISGPQILNFTSSESSIANTWSDLYTGINRANLVLENIDKPVMDSASRATIKGQALFLRAYYYFLLVSNWGDVPLKLHSTNSPDSISISRKKDTTVYNQIIGDMIAADSLVQPATFYNYAGRITNTTVEGILARVCLYRAGLFTAGFSKIDDRAIWFANSLYWSSKVINSGIHTLNPSYSQVFINHCQDVYDVNYKESMWEVEFYGTGNGNPYPQSGRVGNISGIKCTDLSMGYSYGYIDAQSKLYNSFAVGDSFRRDWSIAPYHLDTVLGGGGVVTQVRWTATSIYTRNNGKWRREFENGNNKQKNGTSINYPLLRYADVLLMYAEAANEVNGHPTDSAYLAVNQVRRRAYKLPLATTNVKYDLKGGLSYQSFQDSIRNERYKELCFEALRRNDLIRWGKYLSTMQDMANNMPAGASAMAAVAANNIQPKNVLFPIPINELSLNPGIGKQNAGW